MDQALVSQRNKVKLIHEGYAYVFDRTSKDGMRKFWRCQQRGYCKARVHTTTDHVVVERKGEHSHDSDISGIEASKIQVAIKRRAKETMEMPSQIANNAIQNTDKAIQGKLPRKDALRKMVQRVRNAGIAVPIAPISLKALVIPEAYTKYEYMPNKEELFLLRDSGGDPRILLFGRESHLRYVPDMKIIFMDGTFKQAPPLFAQIFVILAKRSGFVFPIFYALLPNKLEATYKRLFDLLKDLCPGFQPDSISLDFEKAVMNAVQSKFPTAAMFGCLFHLTKNLRKQLAHYNLLGRYQTEPMFELQARSVISLAFVPIADLDTAFDALAENSPPELDPILNWFEDYYLGRMNRNRRGRRRATFPQEMWSVYNRVLNRQDRTNNHAEAAHRRLQTEIDMNHPSIWKLIDALRSVQKGQDLDYQYYVRGEEPPRKRSKYQEADNRILTIVTDYENRDILDYLEGLAHNFVME